MARLMLRKGFTLSPAPGGVGHLTDSRSGDVLVVPPADYALLSSGAEQGLDTERGDISEVVNRYRPFYVDFVAQPGFYELDIEDAPTVPQIPSIAPVTMTPAPQPQPEAPAAFEEPETKDDLPLAQLMPEADDAGDLTQPEGKQAVPAPSAVEQSPADQNAADQISAVQESQHTEQVQQPPEAEPVRLAAPEPPPPSEPTSSKPSPLLLAFAGILILGLGVGATFLLRPDLFTSSEGPTQPNPTTVVKPAPVPPPPTEPEPVVDAGAPAEPEIVDAGVAEAVIDAGVAPVAVTPEPVAVVDAGSEEVAVEETTSEVNWLESPVQARGRVKMGEVQASASGVVTWSVQLEERVKTKQSLGSIAREGGAESPLISPNVGLAMLKQPSGSTVKRGDVIAEIIYFEAWAKGLVKGKPTAAWRCEIVSASANKKADCKISVITPKAGGAQLTVAVEPRWFDDATDAVLRVAPP